MFEKQKLDPTNKGILTPQVIVGIVLLFLVMGYGIIKIASARVHENLLVFLAPIEQACASAQGCPVVPQGWVALTELNAAARENLQDLPAARNCASPAQSSSYRALVYCSTPEAFVVRWPYLKDAMIIVTGGGGQAMALKDVNV